MTLEKKSKRDIILESAYSLFVEKGYFDAKIIDIAEAAGIGKGTIYEYFRSKDEIFLELFRTKVASGYDTLSEIISEQDSCEKKVKVYINTELENMARLSFNRSFLIDLMTKSDAFHNIELVKEIHSLIGDKFKIMHSIIEEGVLSGEFSQIDPVLATVSTMGAINFYTTFSYCPFNPSDYIGSEKIKDFDKEQFIEMILKGLRP